MHARVLAEREKLGYFTVYSLKGIMVGSVTHGRFPVGHMVDTT
jgi:hypothetical protein